jgi:hypothetical protein
VEVHVIGRGDDDGLDVFLFFEHDAEVGVFRNVGIAVEHRAGAVGIDIAQADDILVADGGLARVAAALPAAADDGDVEALVSAGLGGVRFGDAAGQPESRGRGRDAAGLEESPTIELASHERLLRRNLVGRTFC